MEVRRELLFNNENAYRVTTILLALSQGGLEETLIPDIAIKANISRSVAGYWIDIFESCGFIATTRYEHRKDAICKKQPHIIVHMKSKKKIAYLYNYMWLQKWEARFCADIAPLQIVKAA